MDVNLPLRPIKRYMLDKKSIMEAAIGHILADEHGIVGFKATSQEGDQVSMTSGADDLSFVEKSLFRPQWTV